MPHVAVLDLSLTLPHPGEGHPSGARGSVGHQAPGARRARVQVRASLGLGALVEAVQAAFGLPAPASWSLHTQADTLEAPILLAERSPGAPAPRTRVSRLLTTQGPVSLRADGAEFGVTLVELTERAAADRVRVVAVLASPEHRVTAREDVGALFLPAARRSGSRDSDVTAAPLAGRGPATRRPPAAPTAEGSPASARRAVREANPAEDPNAVDAPSGADDVERGPEVGFAPPPHLTALATHTAHLVRLATATGVAGAWRETPLPCRRRRGRRPCPGTLSVRRNDAAGEVEGRCPVCGDHERVSGHVGSDDDLSAHSAHATREASVFLPEGSWMALLGLPLLDDATLRFVYDATPASGGVLLRGRWADVEALADAAAAEALHGDDQRRSDPIEDALAFLEAALRHGR